MENLSEDEHEEIINSEEEEVKEGKNLDIVRVMSILFVVFVYLVIFMKILFLK